MKTPTHITLRSTFGMNSWVSGGCSEAVPVLAGSVLTLFPGHPHWHCGDTRYCRSTGRRSYRRRWAAALNQCRRHTPLLPVLHEDQICPYLLLFFTDLNRKSNAVAQKSSNKTSRYAPDCLLLLTELLQLDTCSFQKIP